MSTLRLNRPRVVSGILLYAVFLSNLSFAQQPPAVDVSRPAPPAGRINSEATERTPELSQAKISPQSFVAKVAVINRAEIELGQLALKNSTDASVKKYAQQMVTDHSAADKKLKSVAAKENLNLPQSLDPEHRALRDKLANLKGNEFDREYSKVMAEGHDKATVLFEAASQTQQLPAALKEFAASTLTTIKQHREHAHKLQEIEGA